MKTSISSRIAKLKRFSTVRILTSAAVLALPVATTFGQSFYTNSTGDFNVSASWNPNGVPSGNVNATDDNGSNNVILIQPGDPVWGHGDTLAGQTIGSSGAYIQTGSTNNTGYPNNGNWLRLGVGTGGTFGSYILSNGVVNVAGQTHIGEEGNAYLEIDGGVYNTGYNGNPGLCAGDGDWGPSTGTLVLNGGSITNISNETWFGESGSAGVGTGYFYMNGGTFTAYSWFVFGRGGGTGVGIMTNGTLNVLGSSIANQEFLIGGGGNGTLIQSGGTINVQNQYLIPQSGGAANAFKGTNILSGNAVLNTHDWIAIGRSSGYGELDISGNASITRDNANEGSANFDVGAGGPGILNQNGGAITNLAGQTRIGDGSTATWNLNSGIAYLGEVHITQSTGGSGHLNVNGGSLYANEITTGGTATGSALNLNGGTILALGNNPTFIHDITEVFVGAGGITFDSQGYNIGIAQELDDSGGGNVIKNGAGTLTFSGANTYSGNTIVNAGSLIVATSVGNSVNYTIADNAGFGVTVLSAGAQVSAANFSLGNSAGTTVSLDFGNIASPASAPLNVNGTLTANGTTVINVLNLLATTGNLPLIQFGSLAGAGRFVIGSLPSGVVGNIVTNGNTIALNITQVNQPRWSGAAGSNWDIGVTENWVNAGSGTPTYYFDGNSSLFDDTASGTTTVNLVTNVLPASVVFTNNSLPYTLVGTGAIGGMIGINIEGSGTVTILNTNNFTGPVVVSGGQLVVTNLANGGLPSSIGASSADPSNLVLAGGTLSYSGPATSIDRGYSVQNTNSMIDTESALTLSGTMTAAAAGDLTKTGPARLTYTSVGVNTLSGTAGGGFTVQNGSVLFNGSAGSQSNIIQGVHLGVDGSVSNATVFLTNTVLNTSGNVDIGDIANTFGTLVVNNGTTLNIGSWMILGNGNNSTATFTQNGGTVNLLNGMLLLGGAMGTTNTLNINGGVLNQGGSYNFDIADGSWNGSGARNGVVNQTGGTLNISSGGSIYVANAPLATAVYNLSGGTLNYSNWLAIGRDGAVGTFNMSGGVLNKGNNNGNLDIGTSAGIGGVAGSAYFNQTGGAITNTASQTWLGEGTSGQPAFGIWNMSGGTAQLAETHIGQGGIGTNILNISGTGSITCAGYVDLALDATIANVSIGSVSQPGGSLTVMNDMTVADTGTATLNMVTNGGGLLTVQGTLYLSRGSATANGIVNLNAGTTIALNYLNNGWGFGHGLTNNPQSFNFNGGTLKALVGSTYFIQPFVNTVIQSGGAIIDDGGFAVSANAALVNGGGSGGLTKQGSGTLYLNGINTYSGSTLVNAGTLGGSGTIAGPVNVAAGATLLADGGSVGTFTINNALTFASGSTASFKITSSSNDQIVGLTGVSYNGTLVVTNAGASPLTVGATYTLFSSSTTGAGNFSTVEVLPSGSGTFNPTTGVLTITSAGSGVIFNPVTVNSGNLILTGAGGTPGNPYALLTSTNLLTPMALWTTNTLGTFGVTGTFSNAIPVSATIPAQFFRIQY